MNRLKLLGTAVGMCAGISVARGQDTTSVPTAQPKNPTNYDAATGTLTIG